MTTVVEQTSYQKMMQTALMRKSWSLYWGTVPFNVIQKRRTKNRIAKASRKKNR